MPDEPLDRRILREIRDRLKQSREAVDEYHRLEAALAALEPAAAAVSQRAPSRRRREPVKPRAPRGANRDKALAIIAERPGVTIAELAAATGIKRNVLYGVTRTLTARGAIQRVALGDDAFGFRKSDSDSSPPDGSDEPDSAEKA
jgi:IclR helix-turn-helix domain